MDLLGMALGGKSIEEVGAEKQDSDLCAFVKDKLEEIRGSATRIAHEKIWYENAAYYYGYAGLSYNYQLKQYQPVARGMNASSKNKRNVNKILPTLQNRLSRLVKSYPKFDVIPNGNTQEDKDNARFKLDVLSTLFSRLEFQNKRINLITSVQIYGHAYMAATWDDCVGNMMMDPETGEYEFEGDVRLEVVSPFEVFPDPLAKSYDEARYFIRAKVRPLDYFANHYPGAGDKVEAEETWLASAQYDQRINSMSKNQTGTTTQAKNSAIELSYYEMPSRKYKLGRMVVCANGKILENKPLPVGLVPLVKYDDIVSPKFYSEAMCTHLRPLQDHYNDIRSRCADWSRKLISGKFVAARGTQIQREALSDESGELLEFTPVANAPNGGEPKQLDIPTIPSYVYQELQTIDGDFNDISGISDVSRGQTPQGSSNMPAIGMQLLQEQDETRIGIMTTQHELATAKLGKLILDLVQVGYTKPRKLKISGPFNAYNVQDIDSQSLSGINDVLVIPGSMAPQSQALKRQELANAYDRGWLGNPQDPLVIEKVVQMMEFGDIAQPYVKPSLQAKQAQDFIKKIKQNEAPAINDYDNHAYLLLELDNFRISEEIKELGPEVYECLMLTMNGLTQKIGEMTGAIPEHMDPAVGQELQARAEQETTPEQMQQPTPAANQLGQTLDNRGIQ